MNNSALAFLRVGFRAAHSFQRAAVHGKITQKNCVTAFFNHAAPKCMVSCYHAITMQFVVCLHAYVSKVHWGAIKTNGTAALLQKGCTLLECSAQMHIDVDLA